MSSFKYKIIEKIGEGGQSTVYKITEERERERETNKKGRIGIDSSSIYALKKVNCKSFKELNQSLEEVQCLLKLNHKNIIQVHKFFIERKKIQSSSLFVVDGDISKEDNNEYYLCIVNEYLEKGNLKLYINRKRKKNRCIKIEIILMIIQQLCLGIEKIHQFNILHRDLKPENIFLSEIINKDEGNVNRIHIKIGDFGFSKDLMKDSLTKTVLGSPLFLAPEVKNQVSYGQSIDYFGISAILLDLLLPKTVDYSFALASNRNKIITQIKERYNEEISLFVDKIVQLEPQDRPNPRKIIEYINNLKLKLNIRIEEKDDFNMEDVYLLREQLSSKQLVIEKLRNNQSTRNEHHFSLQFSKINKHRDIFVSESGLSCSKISSERGNRNIAITKTFQRGINRWFIKYINEGSFINSVIGICSPNIDFTKVSKSIGGSIENSYGLFLRDGYVFFNRSSKPFIKEKIKNGDVFEVILDLDKRELGFKVNGIGGIAFENIPQICFTGAISIYSSNEVFVLMS